MIYFLAIKIHLGLTSKMQSFLNSFESYKFLTFTQNDKKNFDQDLVNLSVTQIPIDKQLGSFNFNILTRGTHCSQCSICKYI